MSQLRLSRAALLIAALLTSACHPEIRSTLTGTMTPKLMAELWYLPEPDRNLFWGVGGQRLVPDAAARYRVIDIKRTGYSRGLTVEGPGNRKWSAKFPPEAPTEVVASRIVWGLGYHQPPIYYVGRWNAEGAPDPNPQLPARFREAKPDFHGLKAKGLWSYYHNPFVGTRQMKGLLVLQAMLGNSDLKDEQNALYELDDVVEGARRWYVARDLGQSFGRTGMVHPPRGDIQVFEQAPFIKGVVHGKVRFEWHGRHGDLLRDVTPADVRWICERLTALTDAQWNDAFRAGGYPPALAERFIRRMKQKIKEGLALQDAPEGGAS